MMHSDPATRSPSNFNFTRNTPCVEGCCGPIFKMISSAPSTVVLTLSIPEIVFIMCLLLIRSLPSCGAIARSRFPNFPEPSPYPASKYRNPCATDGPATRPAAKCASNWDGLQTQSRTCHNIRAPSSSPQARFRKRWAQVPFRPRALSTGAARSSRTNKDSAPRRIAFRASANPPQSNPPACRISLRLGNNAKFPAAAPAQSSRWPASGPAMLHEMHRRNAPLAVASIRYPAEQVLAALLLVAREEQQVSAALQLRELQAQREFRALLACQRWQEAW